VAEVGDVAAVAAGDDYGQVDNRWVVGGTFEPKYFPDDREMRSP